MRARSPWSHALAVATTWLVLVVSASHAQRSTLDDEARLERRLAGAVVTLLVGTDGTASGFFVDPGGWLVTTYFVAREGNIRALYGSGTTRAARVVRLDADHDLALLAVSAGPLVRGLHLADSDPVAVGATVLTFRSPHGLHGTITRGTVSARPEVSPVTGPASRRLIEMNAGSGPTSTGAPLLDTSGRVIGVISGGGETVEMATPSNYVRDLIAAARAGSTPPP